MSHLDRSQLMEVALLTEAAVVSPLEVEVDVFAQSTLDAAMFALVGLLKRTLYGIA